MKNFKKTRRRSTLISSSPSFCSKSICLTNNWKRLMLFRRNDKRKTSFAFMLRTQAKAFDEGLFSTCSRRAILIEPAVCLKNILLLSTSWDKPETRRCWANLVKCITSPQNISRFTETEFANCRILHFNFLQSFNHSR